MTNITVSELKKAFGEYVSDSDLWADSEFRAMAESIMAEVNVGFTAEDIRNLIRDGGYTTMIGLGYGEDTYEREIEVPLSDSTYVTEDNKLVCGFFDDTDDCNYWEETLYNKNGVIYGTGAER